jgi:hypothetical protein
MKLFVCGLVIGALVCFGILRLGESQVAPDAAAERFIADPACPKSTCASSAASEATPADSAGDQSTDLPPATDTKLAASQSGVPLQAGNHWIESLSEQEADELCSRAHQLRQIRERGAKDTEPKDAGWAYPMEQLIRQHVEMHLPADKYTKLQIECRTTFCALRMQGTSADGKDAAEKVVQQIQQQEWSDVAQRGSGGGSDGETWYIEYDWFRPRTESERRQWFWNRDLQRERR